MTQRNDFTVRPDDLVDSKNPKVKELVDNGFLCFKNNNIDDPIGLKAALYELKNSLKRGLLLNGTPYPDGIELNELKLLFPNHWRALLRHISQWISCVENLHHTIIVDDQYCSGKHPGIPGDKLDLGKDLKSDSPPPVRHQNIYWDEESSKVFYDLTAPITLGYSGAELNRVICSVSSQAELTEEGFKFISFSTNAPIIPVLWMGDHQQLREKYLLAAEKNQVTDTEDKSNAELNPVICSVSSQAESTNAPIIPVLWMGDHQQLREKHLIAAEKNQVTETEDKSNSKKKSGGIRGAIEYIVELFWSALFGKSEPISTSSQLPLKRPVSLSDNIIRSSLPKIVEPTSRWSNLSKLFQSTMVVGPTASPGNTEAVNILDSLTNNTDSTIAEYHRNDSFSFNSFRH